MPTRASLLLLLSNCGITSAHKTTWPRYHAAASREGSAKARSSLLGLESNVMDFLFRMADEDTYAHPVRTGKTAYCPANVYSTYVDVQADLQRPLPWLDVEVTRAAWNHFLIARGITYIG